MQRETVLVTGASSGIGRELARRFAADGCDLVLAARSGDRLRTLSDELIAAHGVGATPIEADLAVDGAAADLCERIRSLDLRIDVFVSNAGFAMNGPFVDLDRDRQRRMVRLNVLTLFELAHRLLPEMIDRGRGGALIVGSIAGLSPGPRFGVYAATKAFAVSLAESLAVELAPTGVTVTCLCPGSTDTRFAAAAGMEQSAAFRRLPVADPVSVARAGHRAFRKGRLLCVPGLTNKLMVWSGRLLPRPLVRRVTHRILS
jgi:short-subunit dehydrogenase